MNKRQFIFLCIFSLPLSCTEEPELTTTSPEAVQAYHEGVHQFQNFYYAEAKKAFEQALKLDSTFAMASARLALLHAHAGSEEEAKVEIAKALRLTGAVSQREQLYVRVIDHAINFRNSDAAKVADSLIALYPNEAEPYVWRGNFYELNKRFDLALEMFQKAVQVDTGYAPAAMSLGYAYSGRGDFDRAIAEMERYIRLAPDAADPRASFADILYRAGRYDDALDQYRISLDLKPDYWYSINRIGDIYLTLGRLADAEKQYDLGLTKMMITNQVLANHLATQALLQSKRGEYEEAIRLSEQSLGVDSTNGRAAFVQVMTLIRLERFSEAEAVIRFFRSEIDRRNLTESQAMLEFHLVRADLLEHQGLFDEALAACDSAMEYGSELTRTEVYHEIAEIHLKQGNIEIALDALEEALRFNPRNPNALLTLTKAYKAAGDNRMTSEIGTRLLDLWNTADKDFQPLIELKQLLARPNREATAS